MSDNAFARAANQGSAPAAATSTTDALTGNVDGYDPLFGGKSMPSLFIKTDAPGTEKTGIVSDVPFEKQSRFYTRDGSVGALKFWGDDNKPTDQPVDASNKPRRPVMDQVFPLQTEYRDRASAERDDDGTRGFYVGNKYAMDAVKKALQAARISSREQIKGKRMTVIRKGEVDKWEYVVTFS